MAIVSYRLSSYVVKYSFFVNSHKDIKFHKAFLQQSAKVKELLSRSTKICGISRKQNFAFSMLNKELLDELSVATMFHQGTTLCSQKNYNNNAANP